MKNEKKEWSCPELTTHGGVKTVTLVKHLGPTDGFSTGSEGDPPCTFQCEPIPDLPKS